MRFNKQKHKREVLKANFWLVVNQFTETTTGKVLITIIIMALLMVASGKQEKMEVWFNKYSTGFIGVIEHKSDRTLIQDYDTIEEIEKQAKRFTKQKGQKKMKKIFGGFEYKEDLAENVRKWLESKLPDYVGNGEGVIVEIIRNEE